MQIETGGYKERLFLADDKEAENNILSIRQKIVEGNLLLVTWWAWKHIYLVYHSNFTFLDLIQSGNMGLMRAAELFDIFKGFNFSTYAVGWIDSYIHRDFSNENSTIRNPIYVTDLFLKISKIEEKFGAEFSRLPTIEELAGIAGISVREIEFIKKNFVIKTESLDAPLPDKNGNKELKRIDVISCTKIKIPEKVFEEADTERKLDNILNCALSEKEKQVIEFRFKDDLTLEETGERLNLSRQRIKQIEEKVFLKLRNPRNLRKIKDIFPDILDYQIVSAEEFYKQSREKQEQKNKYEKDYYRYDYRFKRDV